MMFLERVRLIWKRAFVSVFICVYLWTVLSCGSKPTDPRTVIPADSLVYLETSDLGKALDAITSNPKFLELAKNKPDLSALNGIKLSVAVTGFQTSEEAVSEENAVLNFKPQFVAVAETNAWNYQALSFAENKLGEFVNDIYGGEVLLETVDKHGGKYFTWTANDGRKAFALVRGSLIFFGNDESAIVKSFDVLNGAAESIAKNPKVSTFAPDALASGYVSKEGVDQLANLFSVKFAKESGDGPEVQSAVAGIIPDLIKNLVTDITWTSRRAEDGIEDVYAISCPEDVAGTISQAFRPSGDKDSERPSNERMLAQLPTDLVEVTRYNFREPQTAWTGFLMVADAKLGVPNQLILAALGSAAFEEYGIHHPEIFLKSLGDGDKISSNIISAQLGSDSESRVLLALSGDYLQTKKSLSSQVKPDWQGEDGYSGLKSEDGELKIFFEDRLVTLGPPSEFGKLKHLMFGKPSDTTARLLTSSASISTVGIEDGPARKIAEVFGGKVETDASVKSIYFTETRFDDAGVKRRTVSDFGLIGAIIERLDPGH